MAIWQFKFAMVPTSGIYRVHGDVKSVLDEYRTPIISGVHNASNGDGFHNYWDGLDTGSVADAITRMLPPSKSWSPDVKIFGDDEGDQIQVWSDDVDCALDLRGFSSLRLQSIVDLAVSFDCKFVLYGSGEVVDPSFDLMVRKIKLSKAYAFCSGPADFLRKY